jgi:uncharacterized protein
VNVERIELNRITPQPWKNGAGLTREIAFGGGTSAFDWRISIAEVERDAPFSAFPGIDRCIVLLRGAGMRLHSRDGRIDHALTEPLAPFRFAGEAALDATLVGGASSDFNVMTRRGVFRSEVSGHRGPIEAKGGDITLVWCGAGEWKLDTALTSGPSLGPSLGRSLHPSQALLWRSPIASITLRPTRAEGAAALLVRLCHDRSA